MLADKLMLDSIRLIERIAPYGGPGVREHLAELYGYLKNYAGIDFVAFAVEKRRARTLRLIDASMNGRWEDHHARCALANVVNRNDPVTPAVDTLVDALEDQHKLGSLMRDIRANYPEIQARVQEEIDSWNIPNAG